MKQAGFQDWTDAFGALENYLEALPHDRKKIIFIDEMPWMDTKLLHSLLNQDQFASVSLSQPLMFPGTGYIVLE